MIKSENSGAFLAAKIARIQREPCEIGQCYEKWLCNLKYIKVGNKIKAKIHKLFDLGVKILTFVVEYI